MSLLLLVGVVLLQRKQMGDTAKLAEGIDSNMQAVIDVWTEIESVCPDLLQYFKNDASRQERVKIVRRIGDGFPQWATSYNELGQPRAFDPKKVLQSLHTEERYYEVLNSRDVRSDFDVKGCFTAVR